MLKPTTAQTSPKQPKRSSSCSLLIRTVEMNVDKGDLKLITLEVGSSHNYVDKMKQEVGMWKYLIK